MSSGQNQVEGVLTGCAIELIQEELQVQVQLQRHLLHERRSSAGLVAQQRTGLGQQADEIERVALPDALARDQLAEKHELRLLAERRRFVEVEKFPRMRGVEGKGAQWGRAGTRIYGHPLGIMSVLDGMSIVVIGQPVGRRAQR